MGWSQGIGIGWPNASNQNAPVVLRSGWFSVAISCNGESFPIGTYTQYLIDTSLQEGDYVYSPSKNTRVPLGTFVDYEPTIINEINIQTSPVYTSCGV
jgi:hypothetical protein